MMLLIRQTRRKSSSRRLLSSITNPYPSAPTPTTSTIVTTLPNKGVPSLVSRRQWNKLYKPPPRQPRGKDPLDDKPWPRSVQLLGYGLGVTVVPYCIAWYIAANSGVRDFLEPHVPGMMPFLRRWFGHEEDNAVSYVDRRQEGANLEVPRSLDQEITAKERKEQQCLQQLLVAEHPVPTRLRVFTDGGFNMGEIIDLPGTTLANTKTLLQIMMKDRSRAIGEDSVTHVTVEFTDVKEADAKDSLGDDEVLVHIHMPSENEENNQSTLKSQIDSMVKNTGIFSSWHYFPEILYQQQQKNKEEAAASLKNASSAKGQNDLRVRQLESEIARLNYEIDQLSKQLKDPTTMRSFDDIQDDLNRHKKELGGYKSELTRLKWKKRLSIFG